MHAHYRRTPAPDTPEVRASRYKGERDAYLTLLRQQARKGCMACDGAGVIHLDGKVALCLCINVPAIGNV